MRWPSRLFTAKPRTHDKVGVAYGDIAVRCAWIAATLCVFAWVWVRA